MAAPSSFDRKVYEAIGQVDRLPDEFKTWMPRFLRYQSALQVPKSNIPGVMGEIFQNVGDAGAPPFTSPWRSIAAGATGFGRVRFYKDYLGIVHLEGVAETTGTPAAASSVFTLPIGYRPSQVQMLLVQGAPAGAQTPTRIDITQVGDVLIQNPAVTTFTSGSWISLCDIHFRAG